MGKTIISERDKRQQKAKAEVTRKHRGRIIQHTKAPPGRTHADGRQPQKKNKTFF